MIGGGVSEDRGYSPQIAKAIDDEVNKIIEEGKERAKEVLVKYKPALDVISKKLFDAYGWVTPVGFSTFKVGGGGGAHDRLCL